MEPRNTRTTPNHKGLESMSALTQREPLQVLFAFAYLAQLEV